jgi:hypothetical protein
MTRLKPSLDQLARDALDVGESGQACRFRPTNLMERISRFIEENPGKFTRNQIPGSVKVRRETGLLAVDLLEKDGFISQAPGEDRHKRCTSVKPYRECEDSESDSYLPMGDRLCNHQTGGHSGV